MTDAVTAEPQVPALLQPLHWMAAVDTLRATATEAEPTVDTLAPQIQAFYDRHQMALAPGEARAAAEHCLSGAPVAPLNLDLPWDRPADAAAWKTAQADAEKAVTRRGKQAFAWWGILSASLLVASVSIALGQGGDAWALMLLIDVFGIFILAALCASSTEGPSARLKALRPAAPSPDKLIHMEAWAKQPHLARWLAQLHLSGVPLLNQDLTALRHHARAHQEDRQEEALKTLLDRVVLDQVTTLPSDDRILASVP